MYSLKALSVFAALLSLGMSATPVQGNLQKSQLDTRANETSMGPELRACGLWRNEMEEWYPWTGTLVDSDECEMKGYPAAPFGRARVFYGTPDDVVNKWCSCHFFSNNKCSKALELGPGTPGGDGKWFEFTMEPVLNAKWYKCYNLPSIPPSSREHPEATPDSV
ncbi:hypothetical protein CC78DRAFT_584371 [Lojkania enalia]|uniref:Uncharacterized protein n=1 Tax=Lojkania enalia TaxID=147567 RepID=A0A9P4N3J7_9PLEO|nr:hypothetical protein CC78DRAFT_584371 [Didymosphaeria enalia]